MTNEIIRISMLILATLVGSAGFALVFGVEKKHFLWAILSSVICCVTYEIAFLIGCGMFVSAFIGAGFSAAYSDIMAHKLKVPATMMIIIGILPLVPGSKLYYTMLSVVQNDVLGFKKNATAALWLAAGIAVGIITVTAISRPINTKISELNSKKISAKDK